MAELSVKIKTNWIGSAIGLNTVSSTDAVKGPWRTRLDQLLNWVCDADRTSAIELLNELKFAKNAGAQSKDGTILGDRATLETYLKLKSLIPDKYQPNLWEELSSGHLKFSIAGLDEGGPVSFSVHADDVRDVVWGQISEKIVPSNKGLAYTALGRLLSADTLTRQGRAYADLLKYAPPSRDSALTWQIPAKGDPVFRLGTLDIPYCTPTTGRAEHLDLDYEDTSRVLCSMHYDGECVVTGFHDFAAQDLKEQSTDGMLEAQLSFLQQAHRLVDALKLLKLHEHGHDDGQYAFDLGCKVESIAAVMWEGEGDDPDLFVGRCSKNAQTLTGCLEKLEELAQKPPPHIAPSRFA
ncbi:hypothetical protein [Pandoraea oxalativorans]|uniref:Uncharacterized protein n=1 Tax=Pandoraea oxalativorans TaxID=573737 RepID=A0A0G3ID64_9BURK|nr:hypothetical protein [Pandoraea oxalativorans]AKK25124.1 hypothetical protein MB84_30865 [Pandoraea oxalativorans]